MRIIFLACQIALLVRLSRLRWWKNFPAFYGYLIASSLVTVAPFYKDSPDWWNGFWVATTLALLIGRGVMLLEAFHRVTLGMTREGMRWLLVGVSSFSLLAIFCSVFIAFVSGEPWSGFHQFVILREYIQVAMFLWAVAAGYFLWKQGTPLKHNTAVHFWTLLLFLGFQAAAGCLDNRTGMFRGLVPWQTTDTGYWIAQSACCALWGLFLKPTRKFYWSLPSLQPEDRPGTYPAPSPGISLTGPDARVFRHSA